MPDVPTAIDATASRAAVGRFDSINNMKGANVHESVRDDKEKILRRRNVEANGPLYTNSPAGSNDCLVWVEDGVERQRCCTGNASEQGLFNRDEWKGR